MAGLEALDPGELEGKNVILRTDLNLPVEDGEVSPTLRFERYVETLEKLSESGARTLVVAHQGRPGRNDFLSLEQHVELLKSEGVEAGLLECFFGDCFEGTVKGMENGDVTVLENIRFLSEELRNDTPVNHSMNYFVEKISRYFDVFINDGFSVAHRSHGSVVGFAERMESYPGPVMRKEVESIERVKDEVENPVMVLGGEKPSDIVRIMDEMIEEVDRVLMAGVPGELALICEGYDLGGKEEWIEKKGFDSGRDKLCELLEQYGDKIEIPVDLATENGSVPVEDLGGGVDGIVWDIGEETVENYSSIIRDAEAVVLKGPSGAFEEHPEGTEKILEAVEECEGFTVLGGGHTSSLVERFGFQVDDFSHVSIAGGAFVRYLAGEELPGVEVLE